MDCDDAAREIKSLSRWGRAHLSIGERQPEAPRQAGTSLICIDARVASADVLLAGLSEDHLLIRLSGDMCGIGHLASVICGHEGQAFSSLTLVAHGAPGSVSLGATCLDADALVTLSPLLRASASPATAMAERSSAIRRQADAGRVRS